MTMWLRAFGRPPIDRPPSFRPDAKLSTITSQTLRYLRGQGWAQLETAPWANIWIRAAKNGVVANLMVHQPTMGWRTLMADAAEANGPLHTVVGILSITPVAAELASQGAGSGVYVITTPELAVVEDRIRASIAALAQARAKALERG